MKKMRSKMPSNLINNIIGWLVAGYSRSELFTLIRAKARGRITNNECEKLIERSKQKLAQDFDLDLRLMILNHHETYEKLYRYFDSIDDTEGVLKVLKAKEKLVGLGLHYKIKIKRSVEIDNQEEETIDLSLLSVEDRNFILECLKIAEVKQ